jgi:hypothetical protein
MRDHTHFFLEIFTDLVINLKLVFDFFKLLVFEIAFLELLRSRGKGRGEEVEEGISRLGLADKTSSVCS